VADSLGRVLMDGGRWLREGAVWRVGIREALVVAAQEERAL
jgi:hypothetical protein